MPRPRPKGGKPRHGGVLLKNGEQLEVVQHDTKGGLIDHKTLKKQIKSKFGSSTPPRGLRAGHGPPLDLERDLQEPSGGIVPPDEPFFFPHKGVSRPVEDSADDAMFMFTDDDDDDADVDLEDRFGEPSTQSLLFEFEDDSEVLKASMNLLATPHSEENKEEAIAVIENVQMMCAADYVRLGCAPTELVNVEDMQAGGEGGLFMGLGDVISGLFSSESVGRDEAPKPVAVDEGTADEVAFAAVSRNKRALSRRKLFDANLMAAHSPLPRRSAGIMPTRLAKSLSAQAPLLPYHFPQHHHRSSESESESEREEAPRRRRLSSSDIEVDPRHMGGVAGRIQKLVDGLRASTGLDVGMVWNAAHGQVRKLRKAHMAEKRKRAHAADGGRRAYPPKGSDDIKSPSEGGDSDGDRRALRGPHGPAPHARPEGSAPPLPPHLLGAHNHDHHHHDRPHPSPGPEGGPGPQHLDPEVREHLNDLGKQYSPAPPGPGWDGGEIAQWAHTAALGYDTEGDMCMMNAYLAPTDAPVQMSEGCRQAIDMAEGFRSEYWNEEAALVSGGHHAHCPGFLLVAVAFVLGVFLYKRRCSKEAQLRRKVMEETQDMLEMLHRNPEAKAAVEGVLGKVVPPPASSLPRARFLPFLCRVMVCCSLVFWVTVSSMVVTGSLLDGLTVTEEDGSTHGPPGLLVLFVFLVVVAVESAVVAFTIRTCRHCCGQGCCCGTPESVDSASSSSGSGGSRFGTALTASTGMISSAVASASCAVSAVAATAAGAASSMSAPNTSNRRGYAPLGMQTNDSGDYDYHPMSGGAQGAEMSTFSNSIPVASAPPAPYAPPHQAQAPVQSRVYYTGVPVSQPPMGLGMRREYQM